MGKEFTYEDLFNLSQYLETAFSTLQDTNELSGQDEENIVIAMKSLDAAMGLLADILEDTEYVH